MNCWYRVPLLRGHLLKMVITPSVRQLGAIAQRLEWCQSCIRNNIKRPSGKLHIIEKGKKHDRNNIRYYH
nr:MAG TPA: hypothetical protein [Caudoviricetes sp.]